MRCSGTTGWEVLHVSVVDSIDAPSVNGGRGIDHIFRRTDTGTGIVEYVVVESKFETSPLSTVNPLVEGGERVRQMSQDWIRPRILEAVGGDVALAQEILDSYVPVLARIDGNTGAVNFSQLDNLANVVGEFTP